MRDFRVRAVRRALATSLFVPLVGIALILVQSVGLELPLQRPVGLLLLALSAIPTALHLFSAAAGHPWDQMERDWVVLPVWQRLLSSVVALACGLTTGAAVVMIVLALVEMDARAREEPVGYGASAHPAVYDTP